MTTFRPAYLAFTLALLAGCGDKDAANSSTPAAPVAAVTAPAGQVWSDVVTVTPQGGYQMGNPNAPLKLVEYGSRTCPTCGAFGQTGQKPLTDKYVATGKVSYEFRDYLVHGAPDMAPSLLGRCAGTAVFFPLLEQMYLAQPQFEAKLADQAGTSAVQQRTMNLPAPQVATAWAEYLGYIDFVKQRGLPEAQARACLNDQKGIDALTQLMSSGQGTQVTGTPTFFLNGKQLEGQITWPQIEQTLKAQGA